jgi:hypothetical protein
MGSQPLLTFAEITSKYAELVEPALKLLEDDLNARINEFEKEYVCTVHPEMPTLEQVRNEHKRLVLSYGHVAGLTYNLMVQRLGLDQQYYPLKQSF